MTPVLPAVTCSVQASMLTGQSVEQHGIVGNGWFNDELKEIQFWKQPNCLIQAEKVWQTAKRIAKQRKEPKPFTCANLFWWFNMYSQVDFSVTPRPQYKADGRKIPDLYTQPANLREQLQAPAPKGLGPFPLFRFWGPMADITSTQWIAESCKRVVDEHDPTLTLCYLPHLDYGLQKLGPNHPDIPKHVADLDHIVGQLIDFLQDRGRQIILVSEYGIEQVHTPIHINRLLRQAGLLTVRHESGHELLDPGASKAFAVADHQVAHVYHAPEIKLPPIPDCQVAQINHARAGHTVLVANEGSWFTYDYWLNEQYAPDFARTVDIHRKPGYDPRELFCNQTKAQVLYKIAKRKLGFRQLLDVIPLDANLVQGSHGRVDMPDALQPIVMTNQADTPIHNQLSDANHPAANIACTDVYHLILNAIFKTTHAQEI